MRLSCNIDSRGKRLRLILGLFNLVVGLVLTILWALPSGGWVSWTICVVVVMLGGFQIFEARAGWCVVRAMGFRTPI